VLTSHLPEQTPTDDAPCTLLLCGYCNFAADTLTPLLDVFPRVTIVRDEELIRHRWLKIIFDQLSAEYLEQRPGAEMVVDKLTEAALIELIRINFGRQGENPFLAALNDKAISKALKRLHANPERGWTLEGLANDVAMSRAAFAKRFKSLVGQPMFQYLTAMRMQKARELLRDTSLPVYEVAGRTGYESDLAFKKTFKKYSGMTPRQYRKAGKPVTG
jgi:transcriptional regulator GlxA family with amidase domain